MKNKLFIIFSLFAFVFASCNSIYKKHYNNGYTFIKHNKKSKVEVAKKEQTLQEKSIAIVQRETETEKHNAQINAEKTFQTYHKSLDKIQNNAPGRLLSSINKISIDKIDALKSNKLYRKQQPKDDSASKALNDKTQTALILAIVSIVSFFLLSFLSLIPAIIALAFAKKATAMAQLNGVPVPSDVKTAKVLAWITIGLNILMLILIALYLLLIILIISSGI